MLKNQLMLAKLVFAASLLVQKGLPGQNQVHDLESQ